MTDIKLQMCTCVNRTDLTYKYQEVMWSSLCKKLGNTTRTPETVAEYRAMNKDQQSNIKDVGGYLLGDLIDGKRGKSTVRSRSAIVLDLDFAPADFWKRFSLLFDWAAAAYTTHKHTPHTPKYRLLIPLSKPVSPEEYEAIARWIASDFMNIDWTDDTTFQPSRLMFWPSTSQDGEYVFESKDGEILDPKIILDLYGGLWNDCSRWSYSSRVVHKREQAPVGKQQNPLEKGGLIGTFCKTYTIQDAILKFIPEVYSPTDKPNRWTYNAGSTAGGLVIYDNGTLAYSNHSTDPAGDMHCVNAWDLVRIHKFGSLDMDAKPGTQGASMPSFKAMADFVAEDPEFQSTMAATMFSASVDKMAADAQSGFDAQKYQEENAEWQSSLVRHPKTGKLEESYENALVIMSNDTNLKNLGRYNSFKDFAEKTGDLPWWKWDPTTKEWSDADTDELCIYLERYYNLTSDKVIKRARNATHMRRAFHPVRDYLDSLPEWDGKERLDSLLIDYMSAEDSQYTRAVTRKAIVAAVARVRQPGCKMDYVLTMAGAQGLMKSTFFRTLVPDQDWFSDSLDTFQGKEAYEAVQGSWIIEIAELAAAKRSEVERTKQFITKTADKFRKAYAEKSGLYRRQCIFVATTNSIDFLRDMTGNRRWWIVPVKKGGTKNVLRDLPLERDQIWAEAQFRYQKGETLYLPEDLETAANEMQEEYTYKSVKYDQVQEFLDLDLPAGWKDMELVARQMWLEKRDLPGVEKRSRVCLLEIWQEVFSGTKGSFSNQDQRELADILQKIGWIRRPNPLNTGKTYGRQRVYERPKN